jgi:HlyD family secretion protein
VTGPTHERHDRNIHDRRRPADGQRVPRSRGATALAALGQVLDPGGLILLGRLYFVARGDKDKPQYITEQVIERSLDIEVTATGNLRPTNQVDVGSEVSGRSTACWSTSTTASRAGRSSRKSTPTSSTTRSSKAGPISTPLARKSPRRGRRRRRHRATHRLQEVHRLSGGKVPSQTELEAAEANVARDRAAVNSANANVVAAQAQLSRP